MNTNHDEQQANPDEQKPEGLRCETSRRQFLQLSADTSAEQLREVISIIGAQRIMYGSDLSAISSSHSEMENLSTAIETRLSEEEREQIAWKTANQIYKLGLKG